MSLATVERRIAALRGQLAAVTVPYAPLDLFRLHHGEPDAWQAAVLTSPARQLLLNCSRQSGKSSVAAALGLHTALYTPGSLTLIVSPGERQSKLLFRKVVDAYRALGAPMSADVDNKLSLELGNGSQVHALPGKEGTIRGFSGVDLLLVDEASRVSDEVYASIRPTLAVSGGRLVTLSTPWGKRGWWYREWTEGGDAWQRVEVPATACPRIPADFLDQERRSLGPLWFASEYECRFTDTIDAVFRAEDIDRALDPTVRPLFGDNSHAA